MANKKLIRVRHITRTDGNGNPLEKNMTEKLFNSLKEGGPFTLKNGTVLNVAPNRGWVKIDTVSEETEQVIKAAAKPRKRATRVKKEES